MDKAPNTEVATGVEEAAARDAALELKEVEVQSTSHTSDDNSNFIIKVTTAGPKSGEVDENEKQKSDSDDLYICDFCKDLVKILDSCDLCKRWACKVCMDVSSQTKMKTISAMTKDIKGLFWFCNSCNTDLHIKDKEMELSVKTSLIREKVILNQGEGVEVENLIKQIEDKDNVIKDKDLKIDVLSREANMLTAKLEELKLENTSNKDAAEVGKLNKEKETLLVKLKNAMSSANEEKKLCKSTKEENSQLKDDIRRNENQMLKLESRINSLSKVNKSLNVEIDNKVTEIIHWKQEALKADELYKREKVKNSTENSELSLKQTQEYQEQIYSLKKCVAEADEKYALLYQQSLELSQEKEREVVDFKVNEETIKNQATAIYEQESSIKEFSQRIEEQKEVITKLRQKMKEMEERDNQVKAIALRRNPARRNQVCQYYADPEMTCQKRQLCEFEHPPLCRTMNCTEVCDKLHIEGLDFGKWKQEKVSNPFDLDRKAKEVGYKTDNDALRSVKRKVFSEPCRHYIRGLCTQGSECRFSHNITFPSLGHAGPTIQISNSNRQEQVTYEYNQVPPL